MQFPTLALLFFAMQLPICIVFFAVQLPTCTFIFRKCDDVVARHPNFRRMKRMVARRREEKNHTCVASVLFFCVFEGSLSIFILVEYK